MFNSLPTIKSDALVRVAQRLRADSRPDKLDLGVGVYRDADGTTPVFAVVKQSEQRLKDSEPSKSYLPPDGDPVFVAAMIDIVLGKAGDEFVAVQTPGGTGAFHQALALVKATGREPTIWVGTPTWPNHIPMIAHQGLKFATYPFYDVATQSLLFDQISSALQSAERGDLFLLHGCCHNPTGADLSEAQWVHIIDLMATRGVIPIVDFAYQGLGRGSDDDAYGVRLLFKKMPRAFIATSCSKSFGLYRERTGILIVKCESSAEAAKVEGTLQSLARINFSNPPSHGAAIVRTVLEDPMLKEAWQAELTKMRERVRSVRTTLSEYGSFIEVNLEFLQKGSGLFATLDLNVTQCERMGTEFAIHLPDTGRINIAGLSSKTVPRFLDAVLAVSVPAT